MTIKKKRSKKTKSKSKSRVSKAKKGTSKRVSRKVVAPKRTTPKRTTHIESIILHATKINPLYFGIAKGSALGIAFFVIGLLSAVSNFARPFVELMSSVFVGYGSTFIGSLIGGVWAFVYCTIIGMLIAWFYNTLHH